METLKGYIFKPDDPDKIINGAILIIDSLKITLEIPVKSFGLEKHEILLGVFNGYGYVTLIDCSFDGNESGAIFLSRFQIKYILKNTHINSIEELNFTKSTINFPALHNWLGVKIIKSKIWSEKLLTVEYPEEKEIAQLSRFRLLFSFGCFYKNEIREVSLRESVFLKIESTKGKLSLWEFLEIINHFKKFILLLTSKSPNIESITFNFNKTNNRDPDQLLSVELISAWDSIKQENIMCFPIIEYKSIKENLGDIIKKWYNNKKLYVSINLLMERYYNSLLSSENYFLNMCFAIETYQRRFNKMSIYSTPKFRKIRDEILSHIEDSKLNQFIKDRLAYANEPTFRDRLLNLKNDFKEILPESTDADNYIRKIVKTRNYLVHRESNKNTFEGIDLFYAGKYIEAIVKINIFRTLQIPNEIINKSLGCTKGFIMNMYNINKKLSASAPNNVYK